MNKNLLYFSIDKNYIELLKYNLDLLKNKLENFDICCIIPQDLNFYIPDVKKYIIYDNFNLHSSRFLITSWEDYEKYENFLYLDADALVLKSIGKIFELIQINPDFIHGVKELNDISSTKDPFFRFTDNIIPNAIGYNSGTFGFNKKMKNIFLEFVEYINLNKNKALNDQPLYNEFFNSKKIILPTLSNFVYLEDPINFYENNKINLMHKNDATIIHFLGNYGDNSYKLRKIKEKL
jgi:lipopolysaccharide biosynthesis glycosyltransferase